MRSVTTPRSIKRSACAALAEHALTLSLGALLLVLAFAFLGIFFTLNAITLAFFQAPTFACTAVAALLSWGSVVCLLSPFCYGIKNLLFDVLFYGRIDFSAVLSFFMSKKRYAYALRRGVCAVLRFHLCIGVFYAIFAMGSIVGHHLTAAGRPSLALLVLLFSAMLAVLLLITLYLWRTDGFLTDAVLFAAKGLTPRQARAVSAARMKTERGCLFRLTLSFFPLWFLSVLLLGMPFFFVLPYYLMARARLALNLIKV